MAVSLVSGLRPVDRSFESWWVRPGGSTTLQLRGDDRVTVFDPDGGQPAELVALGPEGREDFGALGAAAEATGGVLHLFGRDSAPRPPRSFDCERDVLLVVAA